MKKLLCLLLTALLLVGIFAGCDILSFFEPTQSLEWPGEFDDSYSYIVVPGVTGGDSYVVIKPYPTDGQDTTQDTTQDVVQDATEAPPATQGSTQAPPATQGHNHSWQLVEGSRASCDTAAAVTYKCSSCGDTTTESVPAGHNYHVTMASTGNCLEPAQEWSVCRYCGDEKHTVGSAPGHDLTTETIQEPSCETVGLTQSTCNRCGAEFTEEIPALGHDYNAASCTEPQICNRCGAQGQGALGHQDDGSGFCGNCGEQLVFDLAGSIGAPLTDSKHSFVYGYSGSAWLNIRWYAVNNTGKEIQKFRVTAKVYDGSGSVIYTKVSKWRTSTVSNGGTFGLTAHIFKRYSEFETTPSFELATKVEISEIEIVFTDGSTLKGNYNYSTTTLDHWIHTDAFENEF